MRQPGLWVLAEAEALIVMQALIALGIGRESEK
jgi:hypothetical protein